jgi:hypothetical protein
MAYNRHKIDIHAEIVGGAEGWGLVDAIFQTVVIKTFINNFQWNKVNEIFI